MAANAQPSNVSAHGVVTLSVTGACSRQHEDVGPPLVQWLQPVGLRRLRLAQSLWPLARRGDYAPACPRMRGRGPGYAFTDGLQAV